MATAHTAVRNGCRLSPGAVIGAPTSVPWVLDIATRITSESTLSSQECFL